MLLYVRNITSMTHAIAVLFLIFCTSYSSIRAQSHSAHIGNLAIRAQDYKTVVQKDKGKRFYDLYDHDIHGKELKMSQFEGNVIIVVNVASE